MPSAYFVPSSELRRIEKASRKTDIHEICYLLFGRGSHVYRALRIPNRAPDTVMHCVVYNRDVEMARLRRSVRDLHLLGYLHTHILSHAEPSGGDIRGWPTGTLLFIYSKVYRELRAFRWTHEHPGYVEKQIVIVK